MSIAKDLANLLMNFCPVGALMTEHARRNSDKSFSTRLAAVLLVLTFQGIAIAGGLYIFLSDQVRDLIEESNLAKQERAYLLQRQTETLSLIGELQRQQITETKLFQQWILNHTEYHPPKHKGD